MIGEALELARLLARRRWTAARLAAHRQAQLRSLVAHAWANVPYYRDLMRGAGVGPEDIRDFPDLAHIPVSTKAMLRDAGDAVIARGSTGLKAKQTSGHSGVPFVVRMTRAEARTRRLREFRMLIGVGVRPRDRLVLLGPTPQRPRRLHRSLGFYPIEIISCALHHDELTARFLRTRPDVLWVYPTSLKTVLHVAGRPLGELVRPRILVTSAQVMDEPFRRRLLQENPGLEIVDIYGSAEVGRIAAAHACRDGLHVEEDALHVELLDGGKPVERGALGTVTITAFGQRAMPFIRYEQGDLCRERLDASACGRPTARLDPPLGRIMHMLTLPDGGQVSAAALDVALRGETDLVQYRFVQTSRHRVRVELCYRGPPPTARFDAMRAELQARSSPAIEYAIEVIPAFRMEGIKFKTFVSELDAGAPAASNAGPAESAR